MTSLTLRWKEKNLERTLTEGNLIGGMAYFPPVFEKGTRLYYKDDEITDLEGYYEVENVEIQIVNHGKAWGPDYKLDLKKIK